MYTKSVMEKQYVLVVCSCRKAETSETLAPFCFPVYGLVPIIHGPYSVIDHGLSCFTSEWNHVWYRAGMLMLLSDFRGHLIPGNRRSGCAGRAISPC